VVVRFAAGDLRAVVFLAADDFLAVVARRVVGLFFAAEVLRTDFAALLVVALVGMSASLTTAVVDH
jgi:hypothetical protein